MQTARLFINGYSQAVRLHKEFRFEGDEVVIKKVGNAVVLLPKRYAYAHLKALLSAITLAELRYGIAASRRRNLNLAAP